MSNKQAPERMPNSRWTDEKIEELLAEIDAELDSGRPLLFGFSDATVISLCEIVRQLKARRRYRK